MGKNLLGLIIEYRFSMVHNNETLHIFCNVFHAVGHQNNGDSSHFMKFRDLVQDIVPAFRVKACCWLVQDQDLRISHQCTCQHNSLLLPAGKISDPSFPELFHFHLRKCGFQTWNLFFHLKTCLP